MKVKIKKLHPEAVIPKYAKPGDAGLDLVAVSVEYDYQKQVFRYDTGLAMEIPDGYVGLIFPRSSISKTKLTLRNAVGVIDSKYRGSIKGEFAHTEGSERKVYEPRERIAQMIIMPYPEVEFEEVEELSETSRGDGGFGSTGA